MSFWLARERTAQTSSFIQRFDPRFWTVDFPRPMMAAATTPAPDALRIDAVFLKAGDLAGIIWESVDRWDHPLTAYATKRDYSRSRLSFRWRSSGVLPLDAVNGPTLTIEGRDAVGNPRAWYVRLWNYAEGAPDDAQVSLPFSELAGGFLLPGEADPVHPGDIDRMFVSLVAPGYATDSDAPFASPVEGWAELSDIRCEGHHAMLAIGDVMVPPLGVGIATGYDDAYNQTPARLLRTIRALGYRGTINHYVGMSHFMRLVADDAGGFVVDPPAPALNRPAEAWHRAFFAEAAARGYTVIASLSYELLAQHCPPAWQQRAFDGSPARTGWIPPSALLSPASAAAMAWLQACGRAFAALLAEAGLPVRFQVGEPWWWVTAEGRICLYDNAARAALGGNPVEIADLRAPLTAAQKALLDQAGALLAASTAALVAAVRDQAGAGGAEDLALADFGNRIPSLTFEVFADQGPVHLAGVIRDAVHEADVAAVPATVTGYGVETGTASDLIDELSAIVPLTCASRGASLVVRSSELSASAAPLLPGALASSGQQNKGAAGFRRQHDPMGPRRPAALRYYDVARDFQPGVQRGRGQTLAGEPATIDFPAALDASAARAFADGVARRDRWRRETAGYRLAEIDAQFTTGSVVRIPDQPGHWLIEDWELDSAGVELALRLLPLRSVAGAASADPGRANLPPDHLPAPTSLAAFELPWDGNGAGDTSAVFAAASSSGAGWTGAALFVERPGAGLVEVGSSGRSRATLGTTAQALGFASPHALDRRNTLEIDLVAADLALTSTSISQLAMGANRALVGQEIVQFGRAERVSGSRWRIADLLRGRGGTEWAIPEHSAGEPFVLLDETLTALDSSSIGDPAHASIAALGLADDQPVTAPITSPGVTRRPLSPVHGRVALAQDGSLTISWTRRARGAWLWRDGVDVPLGEQAESYLVGLGPVQAPLHQWLCVEPKLLLTASELAAARTVGRGAPLFVRQRGDHDLSPLLPLGLLP